MALTTAPIVLIGTSAGAYACEAGEALNARARPIGDLGHVPARAALVARIGASPHPVPPAAHHALLEVHPRRAHGKSCTWRLRRWMRIHAQVNPNFVAFQGPGQQLG